MHTATGERVCVLGLLVGCYDYDYDYAHNCVLHIRLIALTIFVSIHLPVIA